MMLGRAGCAVWACGGQPVTMISPTLIPASRCRVMVEEYRPVTPKAGRCRPFGRRDRNVSLRSCPFPRFEKRDVIGVAGDRARGGRGLLQSEQILLGGDEQRVSADDDARRARHETRSRQRKVEEQVHSKTGGDVKEERARRCVETKPESPRRGDCQWWRSRCRCRRRRATRFEPAVVEQAHDRGQATAGMGDARNRSPA